MSHHFRALPLLFLLFFYASAVLAQTAPDYAIRNIRYRLAADGSTATVEFDVFNEGGSTTANTVAALRVVRDGQEVAQVVVPPVNGLNPTVVALTFPAAPFAGQIEEFRAALGLDDIEPAASGTTQNNFARITLDFSKLTAASTPTAPPAHAAQPSGIFAQVTSEQWVLVGVSAICLLLTLFGLFTLFALLRPAPQFGNWQAPYINGVPTDPNTTAGRRQGWQPHAQNNLLPPSAAEGQTSIRKFLLPTPTGERPAWQLRALRLTQFDVYGRVPRSQVIAPARLVRQVNGLLHKQGQWEAEKLQRKLLPAARQLARQARRRMTEQTVMLPLALDVGLAGATGRAQVQFELSQWAGGAWRALDHWQPEMVVNQKQVRDQMTFTLNGQRPQETLRDFESRLATDLLYALLNVFATPPQQH